MREILSSQIRTKSGGACSIGTRKGASWGVSGSGSPETAMGSRTAAAKKPPSRGRVVPRAHLVT